MMNRAYYYLLFLLLPALTCCTNEAERTRMRSGLDSLNVRNRTDLPFTPADVQPYVDFFDRHGTANDRLLAHYLMGRAYHKQGEAPMALQYYQQAAECADTTARDCDFAQLSRVYGQMAGLFYNQLLYHEQLEYLDNATMHAWKGTDTLAALMFKEQKSLAFQRLGQFDRAISNIEDVADQFKKYGYNTNAAIALGSIIMTLIEHGNYEKATRYFRIYDNESGLTIDQNKPEIYSYFRGLLFLKTGKIDSAKYWFRKELQNATDYNNKNAGAWGLANAFNLSHQNDSASKYYKYAYEMNDSAYAEMAINEVERMQAMYNYSRHQKIALEEKELSSRLKNRLTYSISLSVIFGLVLYIILYYINNKRKDAVRNYENSLKQIEQAHYDLIRLQDLDRNRQVLIDEKDAQINQLQIEIKTYQNHKNESNHNKIEKDIKESVEYKRFSELSRKGLIPSDKEWQELRVMAFSYLPDFYQLLISKRHLINLKEYNACVLIRLHYKPSDLCNMLEISSGHANKIRKQLLQKLFGIEGKADLFDSKIITYY